MNSKLQELTDKIYLEGVEKGQSEAKTLIENAKSEAADILAKAKVEADKLIKIAEEKSLEIEKNTKAELQLFARQSVNALKSEITDLICGAITEQSVKSATADKDFMQKTILEFVKDWAKNDAVVIETKEAAELTKYFEAQAKGLLEKGVKINQVNGAKSQFAIVAADGSYKLTFGEEEFVAYFKEFLRPKLIEMLF